MRRPCLVRDIGIVREGAAIKRGEGSHNAKPAVIVGIRNSPVNTLELTERIDATLEDVQRALPQGMHIHRDLFRQADFIEQSLNNLFTAFIEGAALVILVVVVFLMNVRAAVITLLALPLSLVAAVIAMDRFGLTINSMSLGGLAIAIGELVDDAIIDVENVVRRLRENAARPESERVPVLEIVYRASTEIRHSVVFATVIVALVFLPLFMLSSVEGRLLRPLGFAYVVALTASLVVALTVTPVLCSWLLPLSVDCVRHGATPDAAPQSRCERWLGHAFRYWRTVLATAAALLVAALVGILAAGRSFLPEFNEGATVSAVTIPGTSLPTRTPSGCARTTDAQCAGSHVYSAPDRTSRVGRARPGCRIRRDRRPSRDEGSAREASSRSSGKRCRCSRARTSPLASRSRIASTMLSGTRANIAVKIFGDDLPTLRQLASQVESEMSQVAESSTSRPSSKPTSRR